jgi:hypothetical protein
MYSQGVSNGVDAMRRAKSGADMMRRASRTLTSRHLATPCAPARARYQDTASTATMTVLAIHAGHAGPPSFLILCYL